LLRQFLELQKRFVERVIVIELNRAMQLDLLSDGGHRPEGKGSRKTGGNRQRADHVSLPIFINYRGRDFHCRLCVFGFYGVPPRQAA
jgi:hypothetical protein